MNLKSSKGFTIAELLVVIAIMGVLTVIVLANFQRGQRANDLRQAGMELQQNFRLAQNYSLGGNSIKYCGSGSSTNEFKPCEDANYCNGNGSGSGECIVSVPLGGYGLHLENPDYYLIFGDTTKNFYFDDSASDYVVIQKSFILKGIHLKEFKLGNLAAVAPNMTSHALDVTFEPPIGLIHFYLAKQEAMDNGEAINTLSILVQSDYVSSSCRTIAINRISGQVSETQSDCSL